MDIDDKVFKSNITRTSYEPKNNLYELLNTTQVFPVAPEIKQQELCDFKPKTDKFYIPKKKSKLKVKTVRDIRKTFEHDMYNHYSEDIQKQATILLTKIKNGLANDEVTRRMVKNILKSDIPISRYVWQMLSNINADKHANPKQYILLDGKQILINGSKGGKQKNIATINRNITQQKKHTVMKKLPRRKGLLQNSLVVKFKPGPLQRKKYLDDSHQKFNLGNTELVDLPKLGLAVSPTYGIALDTTVSNFLNNLRNEDGRLSQTWAEFAVTVLGTVKDCNPVQNDRRAITFDIDYKLNQKRILMRKDVVSEETNFSKVESSEPKSHLRNDLNCAVSIASEVRDVMHKILQSVEISIDQDTFFTGEDEPRQVVSDESTNLVKGKNKKKYCELDRLDVTVIRLPEEKRNENQICNKLHCILGCVCKSLDCNYYLKNHCGLLGCMFQCKCDFSDFKHFEDLNNDCLEMIPGLLNFNNERNFKLAKEEKKFKQTVVVAGERSVVLKTRKRNGKVTKKYAEYHANTKRLKKSSAADNSEVSVIIQKLNCDNIEPWCMVHNFYKCFCKGRFTTNIQCFDSDEKHQNKSLLKPETVNQTLQETKINDHDEIHNKSVMESNVDELKENNTKFVQTRKRYISSFRVDDNIDDNESSCCARIRRYGGRKHNEIFYKKIQNKISSMEKNDKQLAKKITNIQKSLETIVNEDYITTESENKIINEDCTIIESENKTTNKYSTITESENKNINSRTVEEKNDNDVCNLKENEGETKKVSSEPLSLVDIINNISNQNKGSNCLRNVTCKKNLVQWFENSYKTFKSRITKGLKIRLDPPKKGKLAMHPWDFILSRYRERKNLFMVSKTEPFRIFISVHIQNPFFNECMNIDKIRFVDLKKYPITIKNLLTNATDLEETYCILYGFSDWWELIGTIAKVKNNEDKIKLDNQRVFSPHSPSVTREGWKCSLSDETSNSVKFDEDSWSYSIVDDNMSSDQSLSFSDELSTIPNPIFTAKRFPNEELVTPTNKQISYSEADVNLNDISPQKGSQKDFNPNKASHDFSKWFVMTVENDFSEIRFNKGGFFVTYDKILNTINVARASGKTVRLSSQKCAKKDDVPQYGLYTIPNANENRVFIGPYEQNESLGIQTIKKISHLRKIQKTRGIWITTDKKDNHKLIDNPISFIPNLKEGYKEMLPLQDFNSSHNGEGNNTNYTNKFSAIASPEKKCIRITKFSPNKTAQNSTTIKINKSNDFFLIGPNGNIRTVTKWNPNILNDDSETKESSSRVNNDSNITLATSSSTSSQIPNSQSSACKLQKKMFVLKPEQINKKILLSNTLSKVSTKYDEAYKEAETTEENLSETDGTETTKDVFLISDDDDDDDDDSSNSIINSNENISQYPKKVWIQCSNVNNFGWIQGKRNCNDLISLQFPGFTPEDYFSESEAFSKINKILSRVIDIPENLVLEWQVMESQEELDSDLIQIDKLNDIMVNESTMCNNDIKPTMETVVEQLNRSSRMKDSSNKTLKTSTQIADFINDLEMQSQELEDESDTMWNETLMKKQEILASLTDKKFKESMTEKLILIKSMADNNK